MNKRLTAISLIALGLIASTPALARPYHRGGGEGGAGTSRSCLKASARALLGRIEAQFGRVQIVSTCRPGARIAGTGKISKHSSGEAIDFNAPPGKKAAIVRWLIANHKSGGTMTYADMGHIHVDVGHHFVALNSNSRGGYRSRSRRVYASASSRRAYYAESRSGLGMGSRRYAGTRHTRSFSDVERP
jgi:hypothetical protein